MRGVAAFLLGLALSMAAASADTPAGDQLPTSTLTIETARGNRFDFDVELALTPESRTRGLMFRRSLAPDAGMLFVFDRVEPQAFWMRNTLIPLDMLFIAEDGKIVRVAERATPLSTTPVPSGGPVRAVLEINGGMARMLGIAAGDRVISKDLPGAPAAAK